MVNENVKNEWWNDNVKDDWVVYDNVKEESFEYGSIAKSMKIM